MIEQQMNVGNITGFDGKVNSLALQLQRFTTLPSEDIFVIAKDVTYETEVVAEELRKWKPST